MGTGLHWDHSECLLRDGRRSLVPCADSPSPYIPTRITPHACALAVVCSGCVLGHYREGFCSIFLPDRVLAMAFRYKAARSLSYVARICNRSPLAIYTSQKWLCSAPAGSSLDEPGMEDCSFQV